MPDSTSTVSKRYYPRLSEVITVDDLPEFLSFVEDGANHLLDNVHYKNLQYSKSYRGDAAFYSLDVIAKNVGVDLPFGLRFVLNPDEDGDAAISSFPVTLQYQWEVLAFLKSFNLQNFAFTPEAFFQLGLQVFKITKEQVLAHVLNFFVKPNDTVTNKYQQLITDINTLYPSARLVLPANQTPTVSSVIALIEQNSAISDDIPEIVFGIYIANPDIPTAKNNVQQFYSLIVPNGIEDYIQNLIAPKAKASLTLSAGIEFPNNILMPVTASGIPIPNTKSIFKFAEATLYADTTAGIGYQAELAGSLIPAYNQIGNTGLIIGFTNAKLDLSRTSNIAEADAAGYSSDFVGLYVQHASIGFTDRFGQTGDNATNRSVALTADDLLIGSGGISGTIGLSSNGSLYRKFGSDDHFFGVELDKFSLTFRRNVITQSAVSGKLTLPWGNSGSNIIDIEATILDSGDFKVSAKPALKGGDLTKITLPDVLEVDVRTLELGSVNDLYYVEISGVLSFIADLPLLGQVLPQNVEISKFRIYSNGHLEFAGGDLIVPKAFKLKVGPVKLEVSHISLGSYTKKLKGVDRSYHYFGFDGMINTGRAGVEAAGNGIKYYFTNDGINPADHFLSIDSIAIDMTIPGNVSDEDDAAFILNGYLSMHNPDPNAISSNAATEYSGAVGFYMPRLGLGGSAGMRLNPSIPSFIVDVDLEVSTPVPLGATGLGIYGFRGLIGQHYVPDKQAAGLQETATWWDYYKAKSKVTQSEGVEIDKFADKSGFSVGAGLTIATEFDSGFTFSSKLFLLLGLPDVFLIQGQAGILRSRIGLQDDVDPPFSALIVISDSSIQGKLAVDYKLPDGGEVLAVQGALDMAFFFNNASGWYINIGKDSPESERIKAKILSLFQGYAYLMLSSQGIKAGAGASFDYHASFGPVGFGIGAFIDLGAHISFKPIQLGGFISFGGYAYLKVFKFKFGLSVSVSLAVEAPHPLNIIGTLQIKINLPWPFKDIKLSAQLRLGNKSDDMQALLTPIAVLQLPDSSTGYTPAKATNILSNDTFQLNYVKVDNAADIPLPGDSRWAYDFNDANVVGNITIPLDSFIDIELLKPVKPGTVPLGGASNQLPDGYSELLPPQKGVNNQVKHEYEITGLHIYALQADRKAWLPYDIYKAVTAIVNTGIDATTLDNLKPGYWQFTTKNRYNKIRLLSQDMFSYTNISSSSQSTLDAQNFRANDVFCYDSIAQKNVINWIDVAINTTYDQYTGGYFKGTTFNFSDIAAVVNYETSFNKNSLNVKAGTGRLEIDLFEGANSVTLEFGDNENDASVSFVKTTFTPGEFGQSVATDTVVQTDMLSRAQQHLSIGYENADVVNKIWVDFNPNPTLDYEGDLVIGGHYPIPDNYLNLVSGTDGNIEADRALMFVNLYDKSLNATELLNRKQTGLDGVTAQWSMTNTLSVNSGLKALISGSPNVVPGFYSKDAASRVQRNDVYSFSSNSDALQVAYNSVLKVENGNFAIEATAIFSPFINGFHTLLYKVKEDSITGYKKGFALHLIQNTNLNEDATYAGNGDVPSYTLLFVCYNNFDSTAMSVTDTYNVDADTYKLVAEQYKDIVVSIDRVSKKIDVFIDKVLKSSFDIPATLPVFDATPKSTYINQLTFVPQSLYGRQTDNPISQQEVTDEVQVLSDTLNKTVQPVWRPNTTFAVRIKTQDRVNGTVPAASQKTHIFGFQTAGPLGHFHQQNPKYLALQQSDSTDQFKLANLKAYIDYDRSYPDAQSKYDQSKPVFWQDPQVKLYFKQPYLNAMYSDWDTYLGLPAIKSSLDIQLIDPSGALIVPTLITDPVTEIDINEGNLDMFTEAQKNIYLLSKAASECTCNTTPVSIKKRITQKHYSFPAIQPGKLYTAVFNASYQPDGEIVDTTEVHRFSFKTSNYATFQEQVSSFVINNDAETETYAINVRDISFDADYYTNTLVKLIDDNTDNDPAIVLQYAVQYDRLIYGGLLLKDLEPVEHTSITLIANTDTAGQRSIAGILIRNPEPFNDPKLPADKLQDTVKLTVTLPDGAVQNADSFINIYSRDTSAVLITNSALNIPVGSIQLDFKYKIFNGIDYDTLFEEYHSPLIDLVPVFNA